MTSEQEFDGVVAPTIEESQPDWPEPTRAPEDAPNVLYIVLDDVGYAQLGCYGSLVDTPNMDRLADQGLQYTDFHTTALCSPTRSCLLTGRNHHSNNMAAITELATGFPGYTGDIPAENGFLSEILSEEGYSTLALGKWHLIPEGQRHMGASKQQWPLGRGFERFYGFLGGEANQWEPSLIHDNHQVEPPASPEDGYHFTDDITNRAIEYITDLKNVSPDKPFFMNYCPGAAHAPHHVPEKWIDKYEGEFDMGWDEARKQIFERQKEMGIIPESTELPPRDPDVPEWETLSEDEQRLYARMMEVYAGFLEHTDHQIGKLLDHLEGIGELDNTITVLVSDNGASPDGRESGTTNEHLVFNMVPEDLETSLDAIDDLGGPETYNHYPWGWAWAGNTPMRRWKRESYRGGTTDPMIIHWPDGIEASGELRDQYTHAIDIVPTILEALDIEAPEEIDGVTQSPIEGSSFLPSFEDPDAPDTNTTQYYEMLGTRGIYHDGWKAVCPWPGESFTEAAEKGREFGDPITAADLEELEASGWQLYHVDEDFSESNNVADEHPEKLQNLIRRWWTEAGKYNVLPLDGRTRDRLAERPPTVDEPRDRYVYYPGSASVPEAVAVDVKNRSHTIAAEVTIHDEDTEGVLLAHGGRFGGYSLFVKDNRLHYEYNFVNRERYVVSSDTTLPPGSHVLAMDFELTSRPDKESNTPAGGVARLHVDNEQVASGSVEQIIPNLYSISGDNLCCGYDDQTPVSEAYDTPFQFDGELKQVVVDVSGEPYVDLELETQVAMKRQ